MAEYNERIIADLMMGRDPIDVENRAVELRVALHRMKGHQIARAPIKARPALAAAEEAERT